jgi:hypothetical protein
VEGAHYSLIPSSPKECDRQNLDPILGLMMAIRLLNLLVIICLDYWENSG